MKMQLATFALAVTLGASQAHAHRIIPPGANDNIAKRTFSATPQREWNRLQQTGGKYQECWTIDGHKLNQVLFFGGVPVDEALYKEQNKKENPLPRVTANMLITDIPVLLESTYRTQLRTSQMTIGTQESATLDGHQAIRFTYAFVSMDDEVERTGEAIGAFVDGKLYLVTYEAPSLYFFEQNIGEFRSIVSSLKIRE